MGAIQIRALLQPRGPAAAVVLDDAQVAAVGEGAKRFPVVATVNGYSSARDRMPGGSSTAIRR